MPGRAVDPFDAHLSDSDAGPRPRWRAARGNIRTRHSGVLSTVRRALFSTGAFAQLGLPHRLAGNSNLRSGHVAFHRATPAEHTPHPSEPDIAPRDGGNQ